MNSIALAQATFFELGHRPFQRIVTVVFSTLGAGKPGIGGEDLVDVLGIVGPVRCDVHRAARREEALAQIEEACLHDAALVMALLRPGVGKVEIDALQAGLGNLFLEDLDRVVGNESQIRNPGVVRLDQAVPYSGVMNLDAYKVRLRGCSGLCDQRVAIAKPDFENDGSLATKQPREIEGFGAEVEPAFGPQLVERTLLRCRQPARATHKTADRTMRSRVVVVASHCEIYRESSIGLVFSGRWPEIEE